MMIIVELIEGIVTTSLLGLCVAVAGSRARWQVVQVKHLLW